MPEEFSFDVVSKVNLQGVEDAVNTALKEISTRFDFKGSPATIAFDKKTNSLTLTAESDGRLSALADLLKGRLIKRGAPLKNFSFETPQEAGGGLLRQQVKITQGVPTEKCKTIVGAIKASGQKVTPSIQGDHVRVVSRSKDSLQTIIGLLKTQDFGLDLQFENYR